LGPFAAIAVIAAASTIAVPLSLLTLVAIIAFEPIFGFIYCLCGATLGAAISYGFGQLIGQKAIERFAGPRVNTISRRLAVHGILSVTIIRLIPIAPFAFVNMIAGSSQIRFRDFVLGTIIGMIPGTIAIIVFVDLIVEAIRKPSATTGVFAAITVALIFAGLWTLRCWINRND
jgi:uncharacterized membrane protein YdjX (TVP38/TMEM64 family)